MADGAGTREKSLEERLEELLEVEKFPPPDQFRDEALITDPSIYEDAAADSEGWWREQARALDWFEEPNEVLDWSNPPFAKWFADGKINAAYNCLDRHVDAGN